MANHYCVAASSECESNSEHSATVSKVYAWHKFVFRCVYYTACITLLRFGLRCRESTKACWLLLGVFLISVAIPCSRLSLQHS